MDRWLIWQQAHVILYLLIDNADHILWSIFYFRMHHPDWSLIEAGFLWLSVLGIMVVMWPIHKLATFLMLPYLIWVSIAMLLNYETLVLNPGAY